MSLILDALKKAERQHRLGEVPRLGGRMHRIDPGVGRGLIYALLFLVAFGMLALGLYLGDSEPLEPTPYETASGSEWPPPAADPQQRPSALRSMLPPDGPAVAQPTPPVAAVPEIQPAQPASVEATEEAPASVASGEPLGSPPAVASKPRPRPKQLSELSAGFTQNLPELNIDIHFFDEQAARRYVLINLQKYREGDYLSEGPLLDEILADGVVLEYLGERFVLPIGNQ